MIRRIWRKNPILTLAFLLALVACFFFMGRAMNMALILANRADKPVAGWMTPRYIARSYGLERDDLGAILSIHDGDDARQPLYSLAQEQAVPVEDLIGRVQAFVDEQEGVE